MSKLQRYRLLSNDDKISKILTKEQMIMERLDKVEKQKRKLTKTLQTSFVSQSLKQQANKDNHDHELKARKDRLQKKFKQNEIKIKEIKKHNFKEIQVKAEKNKLKQQEAEIERERLRRLNEMKKDQVVERQNQLSEKLNESKLFHSFLDKIKTQENQKIIRYKDDMVKELENSFIWNK